MITEPGIFLDMSAAQYFADPCPEPSLTQSIAKILIERSPAHARLQHPRLGGKPNADEGYDKAQAIGNAAHKVMIGRGREVTTIEANDFRTKVAQETRDSVYAAGKIPILAKHRGVAEMMVKAAREQLDAIGLMDPFRLGNGEVALIAKDGENWFRTLVDWIVSFVEVYDYKTSGKSAHPFSAPYIMADAGWDVQAAMQEHILDLLDPNNAGRRRFRFVMQENEPPFALTVHELSESVMTIGRRKLKYAIGMWSRCMDYGEWPAYPPVINRPEYPSFKEMQWLNREIAEEAFNPNVVMAG